MRELSHALVLGGSGFIGSWLVERLVGDGVGVTVLDRSAHSGPAAAARLIAGEVTEESVTSALAHQPVDVVFHLAGSPEVWPSLGRPAEDLQANAFTTLAALEALRRARSEALFVFVSSAAVYGDARYIPMDEGHPLEPKSPYGVSKLMAEEYVRLYSRLHGLAGLVIRPFSVYGPRQRKLVAYDLLARLHDGERPLRIRGAPDVRRDFVFAEDAARALVVLARTAPGRADTYNLASGAGTSLQELATLLVSLSGIDAEVEFTGSVRAGDPYRWTGDPRRALALGVGCDTPLAEGLRRTVEWFAAMHVEA